MLEGLNIKQKNCHFFECDLRITNITSDILFRMNVSSSGKGFSFILIPERQVECVVTVSC